MKPTENKLAEIPTDELVKQKNKLKGVIIGLGMVMLGAGATLVFLSAQSGNYALAAIAPCMFVSLMPAIVRINQIKTELKSRG